MKSASRFAWALPRSAASVPPPALVIKRLFLALDKKPVLLFFYRTNSYSVWFKYLAGNIVAEKKGSYSFVFQGVKRKLLGLKFNREVGVNPTGTSHHEK
jgi:hypothetical protein